MSTAEQTSIPEFCGEKTTETVTKTIICKLQTSQRKNGRVGGVIEEWQTIAGRMADLMPSFGPAHWRTQDGTLYHAVQNEFPDHGLRAHDASQAAYKVGEAFGSWHSNRHDQLRPTFGDGSYARFCHCGVEIDDNDRGYGIKVFLRPRDPEWWHIETGPYQRQHLSQIVDGDASTGSAELHLNDDRLYCHLSVKHDVEVFEPTDVNTTVGVDLGERVLYALVVKSAGETKEAHVEPGREFRHYRDRLTEKRSELMQRNDLRGVRKCEDEHQRYTDHVTHVASRNIVDTAACHTPCKIQLEDLSGYRDSAVGNPIHDWPFNELQRKIAYKATEVGIPVTFIDPAGTSYVCSECGSAVEENRNGVDFSCRRCGYTVHADVNAAVNIAEK